MLNKQRQEEKRKVQEAIYLSKREEAKQSKIEKAQNDQKKRHMNFKIEEENRMKNQIVNQQKQIAKMKIDEERQRKMHGVRKQHDEKVSMEEQLRLQKEEEVMQMEKLEAELIRKLQNTQAIQKEAYQELEKALKEPSAMMAPYVKQGGVPPARVTGANRQM